MDQKRNPLGNLLSLLWQRPNRLHMLLWLMFVGRIYCILANCTTHLHAVHFFPLSPVRHNDNDAMSSSDYGAYTNRTGCLACALGFSETWKPNYRVGWIKIPDISHWVLTHWTDEWPIQTFAMYFSDIQLSLCSLATFVCLMVYGNYRLLGEVAWTESFLLVSKAILQVITILPDPSGTLRPVVTNPHFAKWGSWIWSRIHHESAGDAIFSGHVAHMILCSIIMSRLAEQQQHPVFTPLFIKLCFTVLSIVMVICILVAHTHYTVDVVLGIVLTLLSVTHERFQQIGHALFGT